MIKEFIKFLSIMCTVVYPYMIIISLFNAPDDLTLFNVILTVIYIIVMVNLIMWAWEPDINKKDGDK